MPGEPFVVHKEFWAKPGKTELGEIKESPRHEVHFIDVEERRGSFEEVATGFEFEDNVHECDRCLSCGCVRFDDCDLRLQAEEYGVDMEKYKGYVRKHKVDDRHPYMVYDPNKCILCASCVRTCERVLPISALGLVGRGFRTEMRPAMNDPLVETSCVSCGNCVDACPTAALTVKYPFPGRAALYDEVVGDQLRLLLPRVRDERQEVRRGQVLHHCAGRSGGVPLPIRAVRPGAVHQAQADHRSPDAQRKQARGHRYVRRPAGGSLRAALHSGQVRRRKGRRVRLPRADERGDVPRRADSARGARDQQHRFLSMLGTGSEASALDGILGFTASTADRSCIADADLIICNNTSLESDHLILAVDVIEAVRNGAKFIVSNSTLDMTDQHLASLAMDPMRGTAAILWSGISKALIDEGAVKADKEFSAAIAAAAGAAGAVSGVEDEKIKEAAEMIAAAEEDSDNPQPRPQAGPVLRRHRDACRTSSSCSGVGGFG